MSVEGEIRALANQYAERLKQRVALRSQEMEDDDTSHYLVYRALGISVEEGALIDLYQSKGRFLYNYAGRFLEAATKLCFADRFPESGTFRILNTQGQRPARFEIDCLVGSDAIEIKWRDATTDGDHITKEHSRIRSARDAGYTPIRVMFYYPNRRQAIRIQQTLETLYKGVGGEYYYGDGAWEYVRGRTGVDLLDILNRLAEENDPG